jgi:hypothetical protein
MQATLRSTDVSRAVAALHVASESSSIIIPHNCMQPCKSALYTSARAAEQCCCR